MIEYPVGSSGQVVVLSDGALARFAECRQIHRSEQEAGGQLFARFDGSCITIEEATGPRAGDRRTRTTFVPDRPAEQAEITDRHARGLHYVGDWHTHPDAQPTPSPRDLKSIAECFTRSDHGLRGFLLIIVGQYDPPEGLHVSIHDGVALFRLTPNAAESRMSSDQARTAEAREMSQGGGSQTLGVSNR